MRALSHWGTDRTSARFGRYLTEVRAQHSQASAEQWMCDRDTCCTTRDAKESPPTSRGGAPPALTRVHASAYGRVLLNAPACAIQCANALSSHPEMATAETFTGGGGWFNDRYGDNGYARFH